MSRISRLVDKVWSTDRWMPSIANEKKHPSLRPVINMTPNQLTTSFSTTVPSTAVYSSHQMQGSHQYWSHPHTYVCSGSWCLMIISRLSKETLTGPSDSLCTTLCNAAKSETGAIGALVQVVRGTAWRCRDCAVPAESLIPDQWVYEKIWMLPIEGEYHIVDVLGALILVWHTKTVLLPC